MIRIDLKRHEVKIGVREVKSLTRKEFVILVALKEAKGKILSRNKIYRLAWSYSSVTVSLLVTRTVDQHISRIRKKIRKVSVTEAKRLVSVPGVGWKLKRVG